MLNTYTYPEFAYRAPPELGAAAPRQVPVVIVGAGPIGLTMALDCARRGLPALLLDDNNTVSIGSRAVCYAKRPLEIWDRLGVAQRMVDKGVRWKIGKVFFRDDHVYTFDLLPEPDHRMPAMINLQQYYLEQYLVEACEAEPLIDLRWKHRLTAIEQPASGPALLSVHTPDGDYRLAADWVIACDGANSDTRRLLGARFTGQFFHDRFLIADVVMDPAATQAKPGPEASANLPRLGSEPERWFWFDPPFHPGRPLPDGRPGPSSVLLHKQADNVWRIDFQLGWDADPEEEKKPEKVLPRIRAMLGPQAEFELEWVSVYQFACRRIDQLRHGRVLFAGDAAHQVSPFGARGANTGVQDCDNLAWKLKLVIEGDAPEALLDSYDTERAFAADDNLLNSTRSTDFITPKNPGSARFRDAVLELAKTAPFARPLVNSGRLSRPTPYVASPLNTPDDGSFTPGQAPGTPCADAPVHVAGREAWLLNQLGEGFVLLAFGAGAAQPVQAGRVQARVLTVGDDLIDTRGLLAQRYDARPGTVYLIRPDQHVAARWRRFDAVAVTAALQRCLGGTVTGASP
ncbi:MAG: FAD-dependent oxidoreductase [Burkholderiales bacterium]|nr:FAD-dependent oxidoreductase [Burkholderiales bacterium]